MIIVSQDKTRIINFNRVEILGINIDDNTKVACCFNEGKVLLGKYETEERAKEVLQKLIQSYREYRTAEVDGYTNVIEETAVFDMPEK